MVICSKWRPWKGSSWWSPRARAMAPGCSYWRTHAGTCVRGNPQTFQDHVLSCRCVVWEYHSDTGDVSPAGTFLCCWLNVSIHQPTGYPLSNHLHGYLHFSFILHNPVLGACTNPEYTNILFGCTCSPRKGLAKAQDSCFCFGQWCRDKMGKDMCSTLSYKDYHLPAPIDSYSN